MLASDLDGEAEWPFAYLTEGPDLESWARIRGDCKFPHESCLVGSASVLSSVTGLFSFVICGVEVKNRASILKMRVGAL